MLYFFMYNCFIILFFLSLLTPTFAGADIYKYVDSKGVIHFTDTPPDGISYKVIRTKKIHKNTNTGLDEELSSFIRKTARRYSVDAELIRSIITVESGWNPYAVSRRGALGLMQLMPETLKELGVVNPYDPYENIDAGVRYLRYLIDRFGNLRLALAAYNAGPTVVERYQDVPPYRETKQYVKNILLLYKRDDLPERNKKSQKIYRVYLDDGTVLYTNSSVYLKDLSSF